MAVRRAPLRRRARELPIEHVDRPQAACGDAPDEILFAGAEVGVSCEHLREPLMEPPREIAAVLAAVLIEQLVDELVTHVLPSDSSWHWRTRCCLVEPGDQVSSM